MINVNEMFGDKTIVKVFQGPKEVRMTLFDEYGKKLAEYFIPKHNGKVSKEAVKAVLESFSRYHFKE